MIDRFGFDRPVTRPYELVPGSTAAAAPTPWADRILVDTVHDGAAIPEPYRVRPDGTPLVDPDELVRRFVVERDWGADLVAAELAGALGLAGHLRVTVARVLLDFNRFPGSTPDGVVDPLERLAINPPFSRDLDHHQKTVLLETFYDGISDLMEEAIAGKLIKIAVHSYDEHNPSRTQRPDVSVISQSAGYQRHYRLPYGVYDPLYPDLLAESTCSRILLHRISLHLERAGFRVGHNYPYLLPDGSLEQRTQVWTFFRYLRRRFEEAHPECAGRPDYEMVWAMLLNTNLRLAESDALRGYLERYRRVPQAQRARFRAARQAYERVEAFLRQGSVVGDYRSSPTRASSLALEVRKDLLCTFDPATGLPLPLSDVQRERASAIGRVVAEAIRVHFETDRQRPVAAPCG